MVSFGGAYALLAYMAQEAVETYGWMTAPEMVDGLGLAETTPGPLILVTQFVGFLAAFRDAAPFSPVAAGILGAAHDHLGHLRAVDAVDLRRRAVRRAIARQPAAVRRARRHHRRGGRRHPQPVGLVRAARAVRPGDGDVIRLVRWYAFDPLALDLKTTALAAIAALLAFCFHRGLIEIVAIMAALGIAVQAHARHVHQPSSCATALSCQRRSIRCESSASAKKITMPATESSTSAANMRGMLRR